MKRPSRLIIGANCQGRQGFPANTPELTSTLILTELGVL